MRTLPPCDKYTLRAETDNGRYQVRAKSDCPIHMAGGGAFEYFSVDTARDLAALLLAAAEHAEISNERGKEK
jgi:hypothetical protein